MPRLPATPAPTSRLFNHSMPRPSSRLNATRHGTSAGSGSSALEASFLSARPFRCRRGTTRLPAPHGAPAAASGRARRMEAGRRRPLPRPSTRAVPSDGDAEFRTPTRRLRVSEAARPPSGPPASGSADRGGAPPRSLPPPAPPQRGAGPGLVPARAVPARGRRRPPRLAPLVPAAAEAPRAGRQRRAALPRLPRRCTPPPAAAAGAEAPRRAPAPRAPSRSPRWSRSPPPWWAP